jgi:uncharacterized membrane protein YphA (DoxX/SURF4 family)
VCHQREILAQRLSHEHPVERSVMVGWQDGGFPRVSEVDSHAVSKSGAMFVWAVLGRVGYSRDRGLFRTDRNPEEATQCHADELYRPGHQGLAGCHGPFHEEGRWARKGDRAGRDRPARADGETGRRHTMNVLLWTLQVLAALLYGSSGVMKVFLFDKVSGDVPSFGALPRRAWTALGILELVCTVALIVPAALHWQPGLTGVAATVLAIESLVFVGVHARYREIPPIVFSVVLGLLMAFIAYGRMVLAPIF